MSESLFDSVRDDGGHNEFPVVIISDTPEKAEPSLRSRKARKVLLVQKPFTGGQVRRRLPNCWSKMSTWSMDEWQYLEREVVTDPKGQEVDGGAHGRPGAAG